MSMSAREAALNSIIAYRTRGARPDIILNNLAKKSNMDKRDVALASNIMNGVLQNESFCDYYVSLYSGREISYFEPNVLDVLRISVYQLLFLDKVPNHAVVSEGVSLVKKYSKNAAGIVNAILRKISTNKDSIPEILAENETKKLAIKYSHPEWMVNILIDEYGNASCERILEADNTPAPVTIIANTLTKDVQQIENELVADGANIKKHPILDNAFYISSSGAIDSLLSFRNGSFYVQDTAAFLSVMAADPKPGFNVLDVCSAPGGKSFAAAIMMKNTGKIISCDIHEKKLNLVNTGAKRLGINIIETMAHDGREPFDKLNTLFDLVITDVPCSGIGVIRTKPDIRYKDPVALERLPEIQLGILKNASKYVKPNGVLLYSTCTLLKRENEEVINTFLRDNSDFELVSFTLPEPFGKYDGMATILPYIENMDGFFICKMRRKKLI